MIVVVAVVALVVLIVDVRLSAPRDGFAAPEPPPWWARIEARHPF